MKAIFWLFWTVHCFVPSQTVKGQTFVCSWFQYSFIFIETSETTALPFKTDVMYVCTFMISNNIPHSNVYSFGDPVDELAYYLQLVEPFAWKAPLSGWQWRLSSLTSWSKSKVLCNLWFASCIEELCVKDLVIWSIAGISKTWFVRCFASLPGSYLSCSFNHDPSRKDFSKNVKDSKKLEQKVSGLRRDIFLWNLCTAKSSQQEWWKVGPRNAPVKEIWWGPTAT